MRKKFLLPLSCLIPLILLSASSCSNNALTASGSTTVLPLMDKLAFAYNKKTNQKIASNGGGSTTGIVFAQKRLSDMGMASRYPKSTEYGNNDWNSLTTLSLGYDSIAFPVNLKGTGFKVKAGSSLTLTQQDLYNIFTNKFKSWQNIADEKTSNLEKSGSGNPAIRTVSRENGSGTQESFYEAFNKVYDKGKDPISSSSLPGNALIAQSNGLMFMDVLNTNGAIGYCSSFYLRNNNSDGKLLSASIKTSDKITTDPLNNTAVFNNGITHNQNFQPGSYAFWHPLNIVIDTENKHINLIKQFITYCFTENDKSIIGKNYIRLDQKKAGEYELFGKEFSSISTLINFAFTSDQKKASQFKVNLKSEWHW